MASSSITLLTRAEANCVFALCGSTDRGAIYRVSSRALALPQSLEFQFILGPAGALGNDKLIVKLNNTLQNETTGKVVVLGAKLEVSVPRDATVSTDTYVKDILHELGSLLIDANVDALADATVP